jgi:NAD(P)-dependent dehydrogenase (short-subunit alcohol dehydrogenase family)
VLESDDSLWDRTFAVNAKGTYLWMQAVLPSMLKSGRGSIVTISSQLAVSGGRGNAVYCASKGAVISLTKAAALDHAEQGVRVNVILPGAIRTPMLEASFERAPDPAEARLRSLSRHPMRRFGTPNEVVHAALYLASDDSGFTTGTEIAVDGGWLAG